MDLVGATEQVLVTQEVSQGMAQQDLAMCFAPHKQLPVNFTLA